MRLATAPPATTPDPTSSWSCTVKIRREFNDKDGEKLGKVEEAVFAQTSKQNKVEGLIKSAQQAVLHPNIPDSDFVSDSKTALAKGGALKFSRNLVVVEINGMQYWNASDRDTGGHERFIADQNLLVIYSNMVHQHANIGFSQPCIVSLCAVT